MAAAISAIPAVCVQCMLACASHLHPAWLSFAGLQWLLDVVPLLHAVHHMQTYRCMLSAGHQT